MPDFYFVVGLLCLRVAVKTCIKVNKGTFTSNAACSSIRTATGSLSDRTHHLRYVEPMSSARGEALEDGQKSMTPWQCRRRGGSVTTKAEGPKVLLHSFAPTRKLRAITDRDEKRCERLGVSKGVVLEQLLSEATSPAQDWVTVARK